MQIVAQVFKRSPHPRKERNMATERTFTMKLTPEQKDEIRKVTGKDAEVLELSVEELEERIAPVKRIPAL
jgi:DNA-binding MarR family transcriptional regulator